MSVRIVVLRFYKKNALRANFFDSKYILNNDLPDRKSPIIAMLGRSVPCEEECNEDDFQLFLNRLDRSKLIEYEVVYVE
jgi:hypothetical protein